MLWFQCPGKYCYIHNVRQLPRYLCGFNDVFHIDEMNEQNPQVLQDGYKNAINLEIRMFTVNVRNRDLVRATGYMLQRSWIEKFHREDSRINNTVSAAGGSYRL